MEPLMFIMAILGCGEGEAACQPVAPVEARYASEAECLAATRSLRRLGGGRATGWFGAGTVTGS